MDTQRIGKFIQELRKEKKWTQEELASKLSTARETVSKWERGVYIPNTEMLLKLQDLFDVSVNEILYGEKINKSNAKSVNSIPVELMKENKKKIKKAMLHSLLTIFFLITIFFIYYFINNYNSLNIYTIIGSSNNISINGGMMIISKEKSYIQLGNINNTTDKKIVSVELYYKKKGKQYRIFKDLGEPNNYLLINDFSSNELFQYKDFKYIKNNMILKIELEDSTIIKVNLKLQKDFSNNKLFRKYISTITDDEIIKSNIKVPKYIKEKFDYDKSINTYSLFTNDNNKTSLQKYIVDANLYTVEEQEKNTIYNYELSLLDNSLTYYEFSNSQINNQFTYNYIDDECVYGKCDKKIINYYKSNYLINLK